jgi:hypothetical protein
MPDEISDLSQVTCIRCGNCCPVNDCGYFSKKDGVATCADHDHNNQRVGCAKPPIHFYNVGIACEAIINELTARGELSPNEFAAAPLGQVCFVNSELYRILTS